MATDLFARVRVTDQGSSGFPIGESYVLVRIPLKVAVALTGLQNPTHNHIKLFQRFAGAAVDARGTTGAANIVRNVDAADVVAMSVNTSDLTNPNWGDGSGVEAWLHPLSSPGSRTEE